MTQSAEKRICMGSQERDACRFPGKTPNILALLHKKKNSDKLNMQLITATTPLLLLPGLVAAAATRTAARDGVGPVSAKALPLAGAVPARAAAAAAAARDVLVQEDAHAAGSGYTYRLSVNASLPLDPRFDRCIAWPAEEEGYDKQGVSNGVNFTWYGSASACKKYYYLATISPRRRDLGTAFASNCRKTATRAAAFGTPTSRAPSRSSGGRRTTATPRRSWSTTSRPRPRGRR